MGSGETLMENHNAKKIINSPSQIWPLNSAKSRSKLREFSIFTQGCLVLIFTTRGVVAPPANNLIILGTSIQSFRHLECQNPSIISESIGIPNGSEKTGKKVRRNTEEEMGDSDRENEESSL